LNVRSKRFEQVMDAFLLEFMIVGFCLFMAENVGMNASC
jgi:hypothetical protein